MLCSSLWFTSWQVVAQSQYFFFNSKVLCIIITPPPKKEKKEFCLKNELNTTSGQQQTNIDSNVFFLTRNRWTDSSAFHTSKLLYKEELMADSKTTRCLGLVAVKQAQTWHCTVTKHLHFDLIYLKDFFPITLET